eukprot:NODE_4607_length_786_cov_43.261872_g4264_i0.p1 GENE.NODE_4607_length_786_cov_43.261872_g4264_i0~~NODE_4607_length_786_cov_43.261872_g4264_i0.p1  ORF type:complete len:228 (-),score=15.29 NODE_4607_length_786_cov_43.261872_g4264_i0:102-710(-)
MWKSTPVRRRYLWDRYAWHCECGRCSGPDTARALRCVYCSADELLCTPSQSKDALPWSGEGTWACRNCRRVVAGMPEAVCGESLVAELLSAPVTGLDWETLIKHCTAVLGSRHYLTVMAIYLTLVAFAHARAGGMGSSVISEQRAVSLAQHLGEWFESVVPRSVPGAQMMRFAAEVVVACAGQCEFVTRILKTSSEMLALVT